MITTLELELPRQGSYEGVGLTPDLQIENRTVTVNAASLSPLDTTQTLRFGQQSERVYAMTERLALFGLIGEATDTYDADVVEAVAAFREKYELDPAALRLARSAAGAGRRRAARWTARAMCWTISCRSRSRCANSLRQSRSSTPRCRTAAGQRTDAS